MVWDALLPKTTEVWAKWRMVVNDRLRRWETWTVQPADYRFAKPAGLAGEAAEFSEKDQKLLRELLGDAEVAHRRYLKEYGHQDS